MVPTAKVHVEGALLALHQHRLPLLTKKKGNSYAKPPTFSEIDPIHPSSLWLHPADPIFALARHSFSPDAMYLPQIYLWMLHEHATSFICPSCRKKKLEKHGLLPPRRIFDTEDSFYIVAWKYRCSDHLGFRSTFVGYGPALLSSLPARVRLAFPAVVRVRRDVQGY